MNVLVNIRCTADERDRIHAAARSHGTTISELVRQLPDLLEASAAGTTRRESITAA
ncbi:hypothetical protein KBZ18_16130 [Synechococcus sp. Cruz-9H2]|uniref:plasmid mobilization protein n=1 Tax=unclassified Synechococcus TaxID=2626047 RepID=UPI0020CC53EF|nr:MULTISPECIES: hypothetical protein [unclassified Synechococcus]MCP9821008.1 hypothetical protein [Synechococcus sp. Cruz-9H2]MCP9857422.1 hypothetical protein [Synechococcus sp. Cruz-9C9]MCP9871932.1 hypothetical protein [Synechococcus sp. Cruz-7B9]